MKETRVDKGQLDGMMIVADLYGFHPVRPEWTKWNSVAIEYRGIPSEYIGWWTGINTVGSVTNDEAVQLGAALERSKNENATDPGAPGHRHPYLASLLEDYRSAADKYARDQVINVCSRGGFEMDWHSDVKDVILRPLGTTEVEAK